MKREQAKKMSGVHLEEYLDAFHQETSLRLSKAEFQRVLEEFFFLTFDAYVGGEGDRAEAWDKFEKWLWGKNTNISPIAVFRAVDNVDSYT
jgi:hypothetical protein